MDTIMECMNMTAYGGEAKSKSMLAIRLSREGKFDQADQALAEADQALFKSHAAHMALLSHDAANGDLQVTIFMVHAADHLSSAETIRSLAEEFIALHKEVKENV